MNFETPVIVLSMCLLLAAACGDDEETGGGGSGTGTTTGSGGSAAAGGAAPGGHSAGGGGSSAGGQTGQGGETTSGGNTATGGSGGSTATGGSGGSTGQGGAGAAPTACDEPNPDGAELVDLVNAYRQSEGLPVVPYSPSLSCVAVTHVHDLAEHPPQGECNLHSWSDAGDWSACCYTPDHAEAMCMWMKPQELTDYPGYGYENAAAGAGTPEAALSMWQGSPPHNDVILNQGIWESHPWGAVGAGLYQGYAVLWFGEQSDPAR
jgi:hypothetical protein